MRAESPTRKNYRNSEDPTVPGSRLLAGAIIPAIGIPFPFQHPHPPARGYISELNREKKPKNTD
ncbi:MAG: hypothetical protein CVV30_11320 [Methanomicrobiales archaeon HGW-Methanomicrobiales-1]|nr:MAG: hypothetical protein CVV30_11320 [Methanomicrobiales archaeon HGW-Methanomicrobiales-1]